MPRRKAAPATLVAPVVSLLDECVIAISGRFGNFNHTHATLKALIEALGGRVTTSVAKTTTHVVCSEDSYNNNSAKVNAGKAQELPLVSPYWIFEIDKKKETIDPQMFLWDSDKRVAVQTNDNKGLITMSKRDKVKKPKRKAVANDRAQVADPLATEVKEENEVVDGQYIGKKGAIIPVDEHCPLNHTIVHTDPDSGLIYDATLNQSNATNNNSKFYHIQVINESSYFHRSIFLFSS
ncbi:hypothetical protein GGI42DRAFT_337128 [Trichoderma sp. SZMC 28013]